MPTVLRHQERHAGGRRATTTEETPPLELRAEQREWSMGSDRLGPLALLLSAAHTVVYGWRRWLDAVSYVWCTPPVFLLALLAPCSTLLGMALAAAPCWRRRPALDRGIRAEEEDEEDDKEDEKKDLGQFHTDQDIGIEMDRLGPLALLLSAAHTVVYGWRRWLDAVSYVWCTPPVFLLALLAPCSTLLGMALAAAPCWRRRPALDRGIRAEEEDEEDDKEDEKKDLGQFHTDQDIGIEMRRAVYARGHGQATAYGTGPSPGRWHRKPLGWGDFSASVRTARLQLLVTAKMVDQGNGLLSVHFWHNATGREGNLSISLGPHATPLRFSTRGPLASQQPRFQQQQQQHRQHHHQQQHRQHQHGQQQHHQYQHQQQPRHQQQWNENYQRHHEDEQHPKQQQHQHDQNNQQQQWNEKQLQLKQDEQHDQHKQQEQQPQQAESKESQDTGTFRCRVEYERVDRALKRAPCAEPRIAVSPAGSSPSPGGPGHGPPGVGSTTGGSCYREQVQSHVWWICSKPISAFCIFIAFQDEDYRLAQKVCPDLHASRNPPSG
ncbi:uncharacterized protein LOC144723459 [Lampetra planeri]